MTLLDQISGNLGDSGAISSLAAAIGSTEETTQTAVDAAIPALLNRLAGHSANAESAGALHRLVSGDAGALFDDIGAFVAQGRSGAGSSLVGAIFGDERGSVESDLSSSTGTSLSSVSRLLPMLAPAVLSIVGKITAADSIDAPGLAAMLAGDGAADDDAADDDAVDDDAAADPAFLAGIAGLQDSGGLATLAPAAGPAAADIVAPVYDHDRTGLGWLAPALLAVGLLILGLVLWQCGDSSNSAPRTAAVETIEPDPEPEPAVEEQAEAAPQAEPTAIPEPTAVPEPTEVPEPTPTPEPEPVLLTITELASGQPELSVLTDLLGDLGLAEMFGDPIAGPFTVFAPTNDAFAGAGDVVARLDGDQVETTVAFHVVPGIVPSSEVVAGATFDTLAGESLVIGDDGSLPGGTVVTTSDIAGANGLVHIVDSVLVPGSVQRQLATSDINDLFALEPIQFAVNSSAILDESIPTLDQAVAVLLNVPAGTRFEVQGHTDSDGAEEPNQILSEERAASVVAYLVEAGVDPAILEAKGYGETQLLVNPDLTPEEKAQNRRIQFLDIS